MENVSNDPMQPETSIDPTSESETDQQEGLWANADGEDAVDAEETTTTSESGDTGHEDRTDDSTTGSAANNITVKQEATERPGFFDYFPDPRWLVTSTRKNWFIGVLMVGYVSGPLKGFAAVCVAYAFTLPFRL